MKLLSILTHPLGQFGSGMAAFTAVVEPVQNTVTDLAQQLPSDLGNAKTYVLGILASGLIQIVLRLIDKWKKKETK